MGQWREGAPKGEILQGTFFAHEHVRFRIPSVFGISHTWHRSKPPGVPGPCSF